MNITNIIAAVAVLGILGLAFGIALSLASIFFAVKEDERIKKISDILPGANCGACGFAGCEAFAKAVVEGTANPAGCSAGGEETADKISEIIGRDADFIKQIARVKCSGACETSPNRFEYSGIGDCRTAVRLGGGPKACQYGCMGLGTCAKVCPQDAISFETGIAKIDESLCIACGKCISVCPKNLIKLVPSTAKYFVACASKDKGAEMKGVCSGGCIGCKICEKNCPEDAIEVENNLAKIITHKCKNCGICKEKCPKKIIKEF